jgi:hypothetical protein
MCGTGTSVFVANRASSDTGAHWKTTRHTKDIGSERCLSEITEFLCSWFNWRPNTCSTGSLALHCVKHHSYSYRYTENFKIAAKFQLAIQYVPSDGVLIGDTKSFDHYCHLPKYIKENGKNSDFFRFLPSKNGQNVSVKVTMPPVIRNC